MAANFTAAASIFHDPYVILQSCVYGIVVTFGTLTNAIVMLTYLKWRRTMFETPRDGLIFNLASGDFVTSLFVSPFGLAASIAGRWTAGRAGCVWYGFISTWTGLASIVLLTGIAAERYYTLAHPDLRWAYVCKKYTRLFILLAWLVSGIASALPLCGWSKYDFEGLELHCSVVWNASSLNYGTYSLFLLVFFFVIPLCLIVYFYTCVYFMVRKMCSEAETLWGIEDIATKQSYTAQVKVARHLFLLTGTFLFAWTPYAVMSSLSVINVFKLSKQVSALPAMFAKLSYVYNPLIFFFTFKRLRKRSLQLFKSSGPMTSTIELRGY